MSNQQKRLKPLAGVILLSCILLGFFSLQALAGIMGNEGIPADIIDQVMKYIGKNHPEASSLIKNGTHWVQAIDRRMESMSITYISEGWVVTIGHTSTTRALYEVNASCNNEVTWIGRVEEGVVKETNYSYVPKSETLSMQNIIMEYIKKNHPDAAPFIEEASQMVWTLAPSDIKPGYSDIKYTSNGWKMSIGHTVTPGPTTYNISVENKSNQIIWNGTLKNTTITETSYIHTK